MICKCEFDYFYGKESEQYSFYRIPKLLFTEEHFKSLSCEAKVLYGLMLDRVGLSIKNGWIDDKHRVYIMFTIEDIMELLNCADQKAGKLLSELDSDKGIGLIERKRMGLGKPNRIYVKKFTSKVQSEICEKNISREVKITNQEPRKSRFQNSENHDSGTVKTTNQELRKLRFKSSESHDSGEMKITNQEMRFSQTNNTDSSYIDSNDTEAIESIVSINTDYNTDTSDMKQSITLVNQSSYENYESIVKFNIGYDALLDNYSHEVIDEIVTLITDTICSAKQTIKTRKEEISAERVKNVFLKLTLPHIECFLEDLKKSTSQITDIRSYTLTSLYNSYSTLQLRTGTQIQHDMPYLANITKRGQNT